jgi:hypothetical protein
MPTIVVMLTKHELMKSNPEEVQEATVQAIGSTALGMDKRPPIQELVEEEIYINQNGQLAIPKLHGRKELKEIVVH